MLKKADCLWSCMEEAYKKKVAESQERQNVLLKQVSIQVLVNSGLVSRGDTLGGFSSSTHARQ